MALAYALQKVSVDMLGSPVIRIRWFTARIFLALGVTICGAAQGMKEFPNRREGTNVRLNALNDFTLIAIHRNFHPFPRSADLNVRFFLPALPGKSARKVSVEAVELQDFRHYFMQSSSSISWKDGDWNIFRPWPTKDVIDPENISPENLGVFARYQAGNNQPVYLPVDVYPSSEPATKHAYTFHIVTGQDLQSLDISITDAAGKPVKIPVPQPKCNRGLNPNCRLYAAGSTLAFDIDMSPLPQGEYHVKVTGHVPRTVTLTSLDVVLYHHP